MAVALVIEPEALVAQLIIRILEDAGVEVVAVADTSRVERALARIGGPPDVLIIAVCFPERLAVEETRAAMAACPDVPRLFLTPVLEHTPTNLWTHGPVIEKKHLRALPRLVALSLSTHSESRRP